MAPPTVTAGEEPESPCSIPWVARTEMFCRVPSAWSIVCFIMLHLAGLLVIPSPPPPPDFPGGGIIRHSGTGRRGRPCSTLRSSILEKDDFFL